VQVVHEPIEDAGSANEAPPQALHRRDLASQAQSLSKDHPGDVGEIRSQVGLPDDAMDLRVAQKVPRVSCEIHDAALEEERLLHQ
jgi:hypothetical protein